MVHAAHVGGAGARIRSHALCQRAAGIGRAPPANWVPWFQGDAGAVGLSDFRKQLASFFDVYALEIRDHGHPTWHPLPLQFPEECGRRASRR